MSAGAAREFYQLADDCQGGSSPDALTPERLHQQNVAHRASGGTSAGCRRQGFAPAFLDSETGEVYLARYADGRPAPMHLLDGLPTSLVVERDRHGRTLAVKASVIAGFVQSGKFYTRQQAADCLTR
ncbi:MAG: hypothetical protein R3310_13280 [Candidatus Competibacteraceae bacterium]|nr:hypothetical protein [Candidatus Competibacteraceae bacterium]